MEYYNDGKRQMDLDFVLTKKQAMQHFFSCIQLFLFGTLFHKVLLISEILETSGQVTCLIHSNEKA